VGRKLKVKTFPPEVRKLLDKLIRQDRWSLREMSDALQDEFGQKAKVSINGISNYMAGFQKSLERVRESRAAARALVADIGESPDGDVGRALVETLQAMLHRVVLAADGKEELKPSELKQLMQSLKLVIESGNIAVRTAEKIKQAAQEQLRAEQVARVDNLVKTGGTTAEGAKLFYQMIGVTA
jgi:uncharacterized protein YqeY